MDVDAGNREIFSTAHRRAVDEVLEELDVDARQGLTAAQVHERLAKYGRNELPDSKKESLWELFLSQFEDLMVWVLIGAAVVSFVLALLEEGEDQWTAFFEPAVIVIILVINAIVGVLQEANAADAIAKLKASEAEHALVLRNGVLSQIAAADLVPGDIVSVAQGDKVPADCRLVSLQSSSISVDQSMLTGESDAVDKNLDLVKVLHPVNQDRTNVLFSGTLVVRGKGSAVVLTTGSNTEMGQIASSLEDDEDKPKTPLQKKLDELGAQLTTVIAVICLAVWLININHFNDPMHGGSWIKGCIYYFKVAVALAVAAIPEGLPAVVTTCLSLGTVKMAKKNAIVRTLPSVETLGSTTVICSDKTGTLTTNKMSVQKVLAVVAEKAGRSLNLALNEFHVTGDNWSPYGDVFEEASGRPLQHPAAQDELLANISRICSLCNESSLGFEWSETALKSADAADAEDSKEDTDDDETEFTTNHAELGEFVMSGTATEAALKVLSEKLGPTDRELLLENLDDPARRCQVTHDFWNALYERVHILEFDRHRKSMSVVVHDEDDRYSLLVKGAPESVLARCNYVRGPNGESLPLTQTGREDIERHVIAYAREGLRIIALAEKPELDEEQNFDDPERFMDIESDLTFVGLTCMLDPPRANVKDSIAKCHTAGIRVIVVTGDNQVTAESICRRIGVFGENESTEGKSFTGSQFEAMSQEERLEAALSAKLFSRVEPRHKLELVILLQSTDREVVAMTGDGINDAPALTKADIGVAMGSGTSVAKEAADMVLKDDNFETIVTAVEEGRAIYANTKQFIRYLISSNIGEVVSIFVIAMLGMPEALIPVQLLWVNLVTDGLPATSLSFNPADKDIMQRPPRGHREAIISGWTFFRYLVIGVYVGLATAAGSAWWFMQYENGPQLSFWQLTHFHNCDASSPDWKGVDCHVFEDARPSSIALSVLVLIELLNALNALSEDQSLLFTLFNNVWVLLADALSLGLHFMIMYVPALAGIFHLEALNWDEWKAVVLLSVPVILLDEILKLASRITTKRALAAPRLKQD